MLGGLMGIHQQKVISSATYASGTAQYITLPQRHRGAGKRSIYIKKESGSGTLDVHPIEVSVDGSNYVTAWSVNGGTVITPLAEATSVTSYTWVLNDACPGPCQRIKIDVNTANIVLSVWICDVE